MTRLGKNRNTEYLRCFADGTILCSNDDNKLQKIEDLS